MPLEVLSGSTTNDCLNELLAKFPSLEGIRGCIVLALNEEHKPDDSVVKEKMSWQLYSHKWWLIILAG
ncbi:hypothetical protein P3X46_026891 [Hevea brasiliensis]|uniref:Uncharacterized protein n=1 Tax=Hevea brasiliensis TaxID=3981 RepID=A0ABQ9KZI5_HEVBR|nr:hypothetical protein P3X46_026891 [Hevea brasiliensis]